MQTVYLKISNARLRNCNPSYPIQWTSIWRVQYLDVEVELLGQLRSLAGKQKTTVRLKLQSEPTVLTVIRLLSDQFGSEFEVNVADLKAEKPQLKALILKNNVEVGSLERLKTKVKEGDKLVIIPITHKG